MPSVYVYERKLREGERCSYCQERPATHVVISRTDNAPKYPSCAECAADRQREAGDAGYEDYLEDLEQRKTCNLYGDCPVCGHWYDIWVDPNDDSITCPTCGCEF